VENHVSGGYSPKVLSSFWLKMKELLNNRRNLDSGEQFLTLVWMLQQDTKG